MSYHRGPRIVMSGLVFALDAGTPRSYSGTGTSASDITGTASSGPSLVNGVGYTTAGSGAFVFDGTNDYISFSFSSQPATSQITVMAWVYPTQDATSGGRSRGSVWGGPGAMYLGLWPNGSTGSSAIHAGVQTSSGRPTIQTGTIVTNQWSMLTMSYNGSTTVTYLNGSVVSSVSQTGAISAGTGYQVGTYASLTDGNHNFPGYVTSARMYNRGLTAAEVTQNFNAQKDRFGL